MRANLATILLLAVGLAAGCRQKSPDYTGVVDSPMHKEVPNKVKQEVASMSKINPTGLQLKLKMKSIPQGKRYVEQKGVHYIPAKAGSTTVWTVSVSKKDATNIEPQSVLLNGSPTDLPGLSGIMMNVNALGMSAEYTYGPEYREDRNQKYFETIYVKARDKKYCRNLVKKLAHDGELNAVNGIVPNVTEETTERDCSDPNHTFNFDQVIEISVSVDNDNTYLIAEDAHKNEEDARKACTNLYAMTVAMNTAQNSGLLDADMEEIKDAKTGKVVDQKAKWSYGNIAKWGVQAIFLAYTVYTNIRVSKTGLNCAQFGLDAEQANQVSRVIGGFGGGGQPANNQQGGGQATGGQQSSP